MWKSSSNLLVWLSLCTLGSILISCNIIDLRPIGYSLYPAEADGILPEPFSALKISFDTEMDEREVEKALTVTSRAGSIEGDLHWHGTTLVFVPLSPWKAGIRYNLALKGLVHAKDGRELRLSLDHPFYGLLKGVAPILLSVDPPSGATVAVQVTDTDLSAPHGPPLQFRFSRSMDRKTVQDALTIEGIDRIEWLWSDEDQVLQVTPQKPLNPWTVYRWNLKTSATSREGIPLGKEAQGTFSTNLDAERPRIEATLCFGRTGTDWVELGSTLNDLDIGQALGVRFSEPMNRESLLQALRIEPTLSGYTVQIDERTVGYIPDRPPEPGITYVLIVSADTKDLSALSLEQEYREVFTPSIPYLELRSVQADGALIFSGPFSERPQGVYTAPLQAPEGKLAINLQFSHPFTAEAQIALLKQVNLAPYFPGSLAPVALQRGSWLSDSTVRLVWVGLEGGSVDVPHYYRLSLAGGRSGITTSLQEGLGYWLKEPIVLMLEAQQ
ncbi:Ig-like domain-containing protein [Gracilinema caldarium]|uniref:SbsA Ig-like domain-containing protein n=1 Tax=Gracilinema caldarium (strain ATCC 51460 / DSM 7334 / H1) TaxID=744872 RepID=F8EXI4_GRAC1|nr:Ig-like domain-containing protein [Gracilinema caldarium]AEJ19211.1 hypothetical protein Spica_1063 [Gracilinema caldarium DSM 7334]